ncbi:hypothetical protein [Leifsonia aquatica]|uniref:hypothetical protein n=1 Tax=Leifsonia aquatica TaxID=144185 RepID=UPI000A7DE4BC|nr:hypothetical protein [Leifsonia aquatica]
MPRGARDPRVDAHLERTVQPCFVLDGNVCAFLRRLIADDRAGSWRAISTRS